MLSISLPKLFLLIFHCSRNFLDLVCCCSFVFIQFDGLCPLIDRLIQLYLLWLHLNLFLPSGFSLLADIRGITEPVTESGSSLAQVLLEKICLHPPTFLPRQAAMKKQKRSQPLLPLIFHTRKPPLVPFPCRVAHLNPWGSPGTLPQPSATYLWPRAQRASTY